MFEKFRKKSLVCDEFINYPPKKKSHVSLEAYVPVLRVTKQKGSKEWHYSETWKQK